jgi:phosphatidylinositol phospholipase C delta
VAIYSKFSDPERRAMTLEGFTSFLISSDNVALDESMTKLQQDMTRPLPEYFINSSHNVSTFLKPSESHLTRFFRHIY